MRGAQRGLAGLQVHEVVKAVHQGAHGGLAADAFEGGGFARGVIRIHGKNRLQKKKKKP